MGRPLKGHPAPRTASPVLQALFRDAYARQIGLAEIGAALDRHQARISEYRRGQVEPGIITVEEMAAAIGGRIVYLPPSKGEEDERLP